MRDLLTDPAWREADLGAPLPDSPFAVSVALPRWQHVIDYEECRPELLSRLRAGYPRFFPPLAVRELAIGLEPVLGLDSTHACSVYPGAPSANRCAEYVSERADGWQIDVREVFGGRAHAVVYPTEVRAIADDYWRYCGEGISGRLAVELAGAKPLDAPDETERARKEVVDRIAAGTGQELGDIFLFPSGMAAVAAVHRAVTALTPGARSVQFDFPYVDVLRVQKEIGAGVAFLPSGDDAAIADLRSKLATETLSGVYCEVPSNPLLRSADLAAIRELTAPAGVPLIADDTVATHLNIDAFRFADVVTTSLTKAFSGTGDVLAGAVIINCRSPLAPRLRQALGQQADTPLGGGDAIALAANSRGFPERVDLVNATTPEIVEHLRAHPAVERIYYPDVETPAAYDSVRRENGGHGGLFSILFKEAGVAAPKFYDALRWSKGPSLGTNFSLACPYTLLAHYDELDWCRGLGVSPDLVRCSVGQEGADELIARLDWALAAI